MKFYFKPLLVKKKKVFSIYDAQMLIKYLGWVLFLSSLRVNRLKVADLST